MRKWIAFTLSLVLIFMASVPAFATSSIVGKLVDSDGDIASDRYDTIRPGADYYYVIAKSGTGYDSYVDEDLIRFKLQKEEGRKYIGDADLVEKKFGSSRYICIEFSVKDNFSDEEYKAVLEANFRARKDLVITNATSYNAGLAFPKFRRATSSDGSYTDADIQAARDAYNTAISDRDKLKSDIEQLKKDIADLERQIAEQKTQDSQQQDKIDAANQTLIDAKAELTRLIDLQTAAQKEYDDAKAALDAAVKADQDAAAQAAADYDALKAPIEAELKAAQDDLTTAQTNLDNANKDLSTADGAITIATKNRDAAQDLKKELAVGTTPGTPQTLRDYLDAYKLNTKTADELNTKLAGYRTSASADVTAIPDLAVDDLTSTDNVAAVESALTAESTRLDNLIAAEETAITNATNDKSAADTAVQTAKDAVDLAQQKVNEKTQELNALTAPTAPTNSSIADLTADEQAAKAKLENANNAVTAQQVVVKTAEQKVLILTPKAPADTPLEDQLAAKKTALKNAQDDLRIKENAVPKAKADLDDKLAGTGDNVLESGETFTYTFKVYIQNEHIVDDDATFTAGEKGRCGKTGQK